MYLLFSGDFALEMLGEDAGTFHCYKLGDERNSDILNLTVFGMCFALSHSMKLQFLCFKL